MPNIEAPKLLKRPERMQLASLPQAELLFPTQPLKRAQLATTGEVVVLMQKLKPPVRQEEVIIGAEAAPQPDMIGFSDKRQPAGLRFSPAHAS